MVNESRRKAGAPLCNKNAVGHGRPPNPGYTDKELIILGEELMQWIKKIDEQKVNIVHLSQWYSQIKDIARTQWNSIILRDCFKEYYDKARDWMGTRILINKDLPTAYGSRFLGIYFAEVREEERKIVEHKIDYEMKVKSEQAQIVSETIIEHFESTMNQLNKLQSSRNIEDNNNKNEQKS